MKAWKWLKRHYPKIISGLLVAFLVGFWLYLQSQRLDLKGYILSVQEDFDDTVLAESWTPQGDGSFHYVGFYSDQQVSVRDGRLIITLSYRDGNKGQQLYGSEVRSTFTMKYGYIEVKAKLPKSNTVNAVISLTTDDALTNPDPTQGSKIVFGSTQHYPYPLQALGIYNALSAPETENAVVLSPVYGEFHTYGLLWTEKSYAFYFDGYKVWESTTTPTSTVDQMLSFAFEFPYYTRDDVTQLNVDLEIDSVKVYTQP